MTFSAIGNNRVEISDITIAAPAQKDVFPTIDVESIARAIAEKQVAPATVVNNVYSPPTTVNQGDAVTTIYPAYVVNQIDLKPLVWCSAVIAVAAIAVALIVVLV